MKDWFKYRFSLAISGSVIVISLLTLSATPAAQAVSGNEQCTGNQSGQCLNMWGGGPDVKSYSAGVANDNFTANVDVWRCNAGFTSPNCPIAGNPSNLLIFQFENTNPSSPYYTDCIGDNNNDTNNASVGTPLPCDDGGANGGWGSVYVQSNENCTLGSEKYYNAHWSSSWSHRAGLGWVSGIGQQVYNNTSARCLWGTEL